MPKFNKIESIVLPIMMSKPETRDDDNYLFAEYIREVHPEISKMNFYDALIYRSNDINIKTIERIRRKLQEKYPELRGANYSKRHRLEEDYIDYANGIIL